MPNTQPEMSPTVQLIGYGEDSLTLWALRERLPDILPKLGDPSDPESCKAFFRPSFGRGGGSKSPEFGEFDFILLTRKTLYLGESKWRSNGLTIVIDPVQSTRHQLFEAYVDEWFTQDVDWPEFMASQSTAQRLAVLGKSVPPADSLLVHNLEFVLRTIRGHFNGDRPRLMHLLLFFYCCPYGPVPTSVTDARFNLVVLKGPQFLGGEFLQLPRLRGRT